ncbi:MAG: hypothetical protein GY705_03825 [Bacteroidetes bacterium]|nr:hypothetical protein [Bacteroidota bacterium]
MPKILRRFFLYGRKMFGKLSQGAAKSLTKFFKITLGKKQGIQEEGRENTFSP